MSVSPSYRTFVLEQLSALGAVSARAMFGGVGLYHDGSFFGLLDDDRLYFKVDDTTRGDYEAAGMEPFSPSDGAGPSLGYFEVPGEVLEERDILRDWAMKAVEVARRKAGAKRRKPRE